MFLVRGYPGLGILGAIPGLGFGGSKRKKSWTRAVFSNLQRKGLEKRFQMQKYITKPDRRQLAASLGLTDAQVQSFFKIILKFNFHDTRLLTADEPF